MRKMKKSNAANSALHLTFAFEIYYRS